MFTNFQFYVIQDQQGITPFFMVYSVFSTLFLLMLSSMFFLSGHVFNQSKTEDIKDGTKVAIKILSILMCLFATILQIPILNLLF